MPTTPINPNRKSTGRPKSLRRRPNGTMTINLRMSTKASQFPSSLNLFPPYPCPKTTSTPMNTHLIAAVSNPGGPACTATARANSSQPARAWALPRSRTPPITSSEPHWASPKPKKTSRNLHRISRKPKSHSKSME